MSGHGRSEPFRRAAVAIALVFGANGTLFGCWSARIPELRDGLELTTGRLGIALAFVAAGALCAMTLSGAWASRAGSRRPVRVVFALFCWAPLLTVLAPSFGTLIAAAFLLGATNGALDVAMNTQGATIEKRRGRLLLGKLHAAFSAGGMLGAILGAAAIEAGLSPGLHLALAGAIATVVVVPATRALVHGDASPEATHPFARPSRPLLALGVLAFCCLLAEGAAVDWSAVYVGDELGAERSFAALAYGAFSAAMLAGRLVTDRLTSALDPVTLLRGGGTLGAVGLGAAVLVGEPGAALVGFAALGAGLSVVIPLTFRAGAMRGGAPSLAAVTTMGYTGFLAGPPLIGAIAEATSLSAGMALVALCAAMAAVLAGAVRG